jgi:predicted membrane protein
MISKESRTGSRPDQNNRTGGGVALLPLAVGVCLMLGLTVWPQALTASDGRADHLAAMLAFWAMSAGFVRGVGFIPRHAIPRILLSGMACATGLALASMRLVW